MSEQRSRRDFLRTAAATGAGLWMADKSWAADTKSTRIIGANDRINIACIGVGGKGGSDSQNAAHFGNIAAVCDVDDRTLAGAVKRWPDAKKYNDYRVMLKEMGKDVDIVTVSTPDHHHAHATALAITMGKAVYCQKPLTHSIWEAAPHRRTGPHPQSRHANGQSRHGGQEHPRQCVRHPVRQNRNRDRSACLDQSPHLAAGHQPSACRYAAGVFALGSVAWPRPGASLCPACQRQGRSAETIALPYLQLARVVGLWHGRARRHGLPYRQPALHGARPALPDKRDRHVLRPTTRTAIRRRPRSRSSSRPSSPRRSRGGRSRCTGTTVTTCRPPT